MKNRFQKTPKKNQQAAGDDLAARVEQLESTVENLIKSLLAFQETINEGESDAEKVTVIEPGTYLGEEIE